MSRAGLDRAGSYPAAIEDPGGWLLFTPAPFGAVVRDAFQRARPAVAAVGLGRRPPDEPKRLPSDRTRTSRPRRARPRLLFTRVVSPCTLSLATSPAALRDRSPSGGAACLVKGWRVASSYPARRIDHRAVADTSIHTKHARKMHLTDFCNRRSLPEHHRIVRFLAARSHRASFDARGSRARSPWAEAPRR